MSVLSEGLIIPGGRWFIRVCKTDNDFGTFELVNYGATYRKAVCSIYSGSLTDMRWITPALSYGVEYCTAYMWGGKPIYTKLVSCGQGPSNVRKGVAHNCQSSRQLFAIGSCSNGASCNGINTIDTYLSVWADNTYIYLSSPANQSSVTIDVQIFFVK